MTKIRSLFAVLFVAVSSLSFAEYNRMGVPDSAEIRRKIAQEWFYPSLKNLKGRAGEVHANSIGQKFQVRLEEAADTFSVVIAPEVTLSYSVVTDGGNSRTSVSEFSADSPGSWILTRDSRTGKPLRLRLYFVQDGDVYIQFSTDAYGGKKTLADYVIGGCYAARNVPVGISFDSLYTASFNKILTVTEKSLPWHYADIHSAQYENKLLMMRRIRRVLPNVVYAQDSAYDEEANPVSISDGKERKVDGYEKVEVDSNGFTKWIVDGLVYPISGSGTLIQPLLRSTVSLSPLSAAGVRSTGEYLNFSLDWTRNLAAARLSTQTRKKYLYEESGVDVKVEPFSAEITAGGISKVSGYLSNTGYNAKYLSQILYVLAVTEPSYFYLAAIRTSTPAANPRQTEIHKFDDSAVIFPYFDKDGRFACSVFEEGKELSLGAFLAKHGECYIHLSRVLSSDRFVLRPYYREKVEQ